MTLFSDPTALAMYAPPLVAGLAIAILCAVLSPLVVLKRLSFVGQGISHAAFGGIGIASLLGLSSGGAVGATGQFAVVLAFCLFCALLIAWLMQRGAGEADTAIGIVLVAAMALGAILVEAGAKIWGRPPPSWESILFGSIISVDWQDAAVSWAVAVAVVSILWIARRPLLFWAFDESSAEAFGVPVSRMKFLLVILLTFSIVTAMKLAGVVLATAMLVLPGAAALRISDRAATVLALSLIAAITGVVGGLTLSLAAPTLPPGACIVGVLVAIFAIARLGETLKRPAAA